MASENEDDEKCFCQNCSRETPHAEIPFLGLRCLICYQLNKVAEAILHHKKLLEWVVQK